MAKNTGAQAPTTSDAQASIPATTKVRLLFDCAHGKANQVVELSEVDLQAAVGRGEADAHPDAVAYAESLAVAGELNAGN